MDVSEALRTFGTGENYHAQHYFGFHKENRDGKDGYVFRVWAPNAQAVHLIGDFTQWRDNVTTCNIKNKFRDYGRNGR